MFLAYMIAYVLGKERCILETTLSASWYRRKLWSIAIYMETNAGAKTVMAGGKAWEYGGW